MRIVPSVVLEQENGKEAAPSYIHPSLLSQPALRHVVPFLIPPLPVSFMLPNAPHPPLLPSPPSFKPCIRPEPRLKMQPSSGSGQGPATVSTDKILFWIRSSHVAEMCKLLTWFCFSVVRIAHTHVRAHKGCGTITCTVSRCCRGAKVHNKTVLHCPETQLRTTPLPYVIFHDPDNVMVVLKGQRQEEKSDAPSIQENEDLQSRKKWPSDCWNGKRTPIFPPLDPPRRIPMLVRLRCAFCLAYPTLVGGGCVPACLLLMGPGGGGGARVGRWF